MNQDQTAGNPLATFDAVHSDRRGLPRHPGRSGRSRAAKMIFARTTPRCGGKFAWRQGYSIVPRALISPWQHSLILLMAYTEYIL
jgi:hypothetical protein